MEKRAKEYAEKAWAAIPIGDFDEDHVTFDNIVTEAYIAGAKSERVELTRWHTTKQPPEDARDVLVKFRDAITHNIRYAVGFHADGWWHGRTFNAYNEIIGWREIHE